MARVSRPPRGAGDEDGMVTAEFAVLLPVVVLVLAGALACLSCVIDQVRCVDAARAGARAAARGEAPARVQEVADALAPDGSAVTVSTGGGDVVVHVQARDRAWSGIIPQPLRPGADARMPLESAGASSAVSPGAGP